MVTPLTGKNGPAIFNGKRRNTSLKHELLTKGNWIQIHNWIIVTFPLSLDWKLPYPSNIQ